MWKHGGRYTGKKANIRTRKEPISQGTPRISNIHKEVGRGREGFLPRTFGKKKALSHIYFRLLASRTVRIKFCCFEPQFMVQIQYNLLQYPRNVQKCCTDSQIQATSVFQTKMLLGARSDFFQVKHLFRSISYQSCFPGYIPPLYSSVEQGWVNKCHFVTVVTLCPVSSSYCCFL